MKKSIIKIILIIVIIALPTYNFISIFSNDRYIPASAVDTEFLEELSALDVKEIEREIRRLLDERAEEREQKRQQEERQKHYERLAELIRNGKLTYRKAFSKTLIVGDSLMNGIEIYNVLDKANIISMVSASLYHLESNFPKILLNNPEKLVLHYGINMYEAGSEQLDFFISMYTDIIKALKKALPDTEIYVSSIFNVSDSVKGRYRMLDDYNEALRNMCTELEIGFVDNSECLPGDGSYYGGDGIHVSKSFYVDVWLPHLLYSTFG